MIIKFQIFEAVKELTIGDWVIDKDGDIGEIIEMSQYDCLVKYHNLDPYEYGSVNKHFLRFNLIVHCGTKEEMEIKIQTKKYNL